MNLSVNALAGVETKYLPQTIHNACSSSQWLEEPALYIDCDFWHFSP